MNIVIKKYHILDGINTYNKFSYEVLKEKNLLSFKPEKGFSYHLLRFSTKVSPGTYSILPKLEDRIYIFLELEQHKGNKKPTLLKKEDKLFLLKKHKSLLGDHLGKPYFFYSTGGGLNLIYRLDFETINKLRSYNQSVIRYHRSLHTIVKNNSYDKENNASGIYDDQRNILLNSVGKFAKVQEGTIRLPFNFNPKYNYKFKEKTLVVYNPKHLSLLPQIKSENSIDNLTTFFNTRLQDIFLEERKLVYIKKTSKKVLLFLQELGYLLNSDNNCINPAHEDLHPSMFVNRYGTAKCKACGSSFSTKELIEGKDGNLDVLLSDINLFKMDSKLSTIEHMYVLTIIDHIQRGNLISIGGSIVTERDTMFNFNNSSWESISWGGVVVGASILVTKVFKKLLYEISEYLNKNSLSEVEVKKVKNSNIYKLAIKGSVMQSNKKPIINNLIDSVQYYLEVKRKLLFSSYPSEKFGYIPFKNKILNVKKLETHKEKSEDLFLSKLKINYYAYLPEEYKEVQDLLDEWSGGQGKELGTALSRTLSRDSSGKLILLVGDGANGKSALQDIIRRGLGLARCSTLGLEQLLRQGQNFERVDLVGKSCNISSEISKNDKSIELESIKGLSVNADTLTAQVKHKNSISFVNKATFLLAGNSLPFISPDKAMLRRLQIFEFKQDYSNLSSKEIKAFEKKIHTKEFMELFFSYLAFMYSNYLNGSPLAAEQSMQQVGEIVKKHNDILGLFLDEKCDTDITATYSTDLEYLKEIFDNEYIAKYKEGRGWKLETLILRLREKGFKINDDGEVLGIKIKGSKNYNNMLPGGF